MKRFSRILSVLMICFIGNSTLQAQALTDIEEQLSHDWTINAILIDGVEAEVPAINANDKVNLHADKSIELTINGNNYTGTWAVNEAANWITISLTDNTAMRLKIVEITDSKLTVDHVNESAVHTVMVFIH